MTYFEMGLMAFIVLQTVANYFQTRANRSMTKYIEAHREEHELILKTHQSSNEVIKTMLATMVLHSQDIHQQRSVIHKVLHAIQSVRN